MRLTKVLWPIIIICSALAALMAMLVFPGMMVRPFLIMVFLFICPGMALVRFLHLKELVDKFALTLALSFSIDGIVAGIYLYAGHWSPADILITLAVMSVAAVVVELTNIHVFVYKHIGFVRHLGALLTHPLIIGTRSNTPSYAENLAEEATVRLVTVQSIANLLSDTASEDIEEKATMQLANVKPSPLAPGRFEKPASMATPQKIEDKPTEHLANVSNSHLSSAARERFEQQETVQMATPRSLSPNWPHVNGDVSRLQPQEKAPVSEQPQRRNEAVAKEDIEEKDTVEMTSALVASPPVTEDADKTIRVSGPQWMQRQLNITNGGFPEDDIAKRPTRHIVNSNVPSSERSNANDPDTQRRLDEKPRPNTQQSDTQQPNMEQSDIDVDDPKTQRVSRDSLHTDSKPLFDQSEERSPSYPNNRNIHKKRLGPKLTRIEK